MASISADKVGVAETEKVLFLKGIWSLLRIFDPASSKGLSAAAAAACVFPDTYSFRLVHCGDEDLSAGGAPLWVITLVLLDVLGRLLLVWPIELPQLLLGDMHGEDSVGCLSNDLDLFSLGVEH